MILFYHGTDTARMRTAVGELADRYRAKHGQTNLFLLDATEASDRDELERTLKHRTFFREPTFVAISGVFDHPQANTLVSQLAKDNELTEDADIVLLVHQEGDQAALKKKDKKLLRCLTERSRTTKQFGALTGRQLTGWMQAFCTDRNCTLPTPVAARLVSIIGTDGWALSNELAKICAYTGRGTIAPDVIGRLVTAPRPDADIFALTDAVAHRNKRAILASLQTQLRSGADPHYVLSMYAFAIRNLLIVKDLAGRDMSPSVIAKTGGLHPFVVQKTMMGARQFSTEELTDAHTWLVRADASTKDGRWDARDALYDFILSAL